jgi:hypothetical protein
MMNNIFLRRLNKASIALTGQMVEPYTFFYRPLALTGLIISMLVWLHQAAKEGGSEAIKNEMQHKTYYK